MRFFIYCFKAKPWCYGLDFCVFSRSFLNEILCGEGLEKLLAFQVGQCAFLVCHAILTDATALDAEPGRIKEVVDELLALMWQSIRENAQTVQNQDEYEVKYEILPQCYWKAGERLKALDEQLLERRAKHDRLLTYMNTPRKQSEVEVFDKGLGNAPRGNHCSQPGKDRIDAAYPPAKRAATACPAGGLF